MIKTIAKLNYLKNISTHKKTSAIIYAEVFAIILKYFEFYGDKGLLKGVIYGVIAVLITYLVFGLISLSLSISWKFIFEILLGAVAGGISGSFDCQPCNWFCKPTDRCFCIRRNR